MYKKPTNKLYSSPLKYKVSPDLKTNTRQSPNSIKPVNSQIIHAFNKTFSRSHRPPPDSYRAKSPSPCPSPSSKKLIGATQTQKVSLTARRFYKGDLSIEEKLRQINSVFDFRDNKNSNASQKLKQIYNCNQDYIKILNQWQREECYEECDRLVYTLVQSCIRQAEEVIKQLCQECAAKCQKYQQLAIAMINQTEQNFQAVDWKVQQLQAKFIETYEKSQWSSLVLTRLGRLIDIEDFIKGVHLQHSIPNQPLDLATLPVIQNKQAPSGYRRASPSLSQPLPAPYIQRIEQPQQWHQQISQRKFAQ